MQLLPVRTAALRMGLLFCCVFVIDSAALFLTAKPRLWCAIIPALISILTPAAIFSFRTPSKN